MKKPTNRELKSTLYQQLALVTKALSNAARLEILDLISYGEFPVEYIAEQTNLPVANTSQHLQVLRQSGLVEVKKQGKYSYYRLADAKVLDTWHALRNLGLQLNPEIDLLLRDLRKKDHAPALASIEEIKQNLNQGDLLLLDVRPTSEYESGHIQHATSIPAKHLRSMLDTLPKDKEIIVYCRGPLCLMADEAVKTLVSNGFNARRLDTGYADWMQQVSIDSAAI